MSTLSAGFPRQLVTWLQQRYQLQEFIETGTFKGDSAEFAATLFDYVLTIETDEENWRNAVRRFELNTSNTMIECWHGDSAELMPGALRQLDGRALIWLDAHCVAGQFGDEDSCPLLQELDAIMHREETTNKRKHFIMIDDAHCFHPPLPLHLTPEAWPTIEDIKAKVEYGGYAVHEAHDIIILASGPEMREIIPFIESLPTGRNALMRRLACKAEAINGPLKKGVVPVVLPAFTGLTYTEYGWMLHHRFDPNQTPALVQTGRSRDHQDIELLSGFLKDAGYGAVFVDIGANIGTYSFGVRRFCAEVHAFEPQRILFNMLAGSVALNGWQNVYCHHAALGANLGQIEVPQFDYTKPLSFGSIEFGDEQKEQLAQKRKHSATRREYVPLFTLDVFKVPRIDVLKIDVEGMELKVLAGAHETIERCRPVILIEHGKSDKGIMLAILESMSYDVKEHGTFDFLCIPLK